MKYSLNLWKAFAALLVAVMVVTTLPVLQGAAAPLAAPIANETFKDTTAPNWTFIGSACLTAGGANNCTTAPNSEGNGNGWLRLTPPLTNQSGSAIYNTAFSSTNGLQVQFQYASYGGSNPGADGFSFYLIDGATVAPTTGGKGPGLGYAEWNTVGPVQGGVTNGYVGIGFDEWGNFEDLASGYCDPSIACLSHPSPGNRQYVGVRGSGSGYSSPSKGFTYLGGAGLLPGHTVDGVTRTNPRWVRITITPGPPLFLTVEMDFGSGYQTIINNINLTTAPNQIALPATFKMGFSASTGGSRNYHEIRNLTVMGAQSSTTSVACVPNPSTVGQSVTCTATVTGASGTPTGTIDFYDGATLLQAGVALDGSAQATYTTTTFSEGSHTITANYGGNTVYAASSGNTTQQVNAAPKTCSANLIQNPDAESGTGSTACGVMAVPNWTTSGNFAVAKYGFGAPTCDPGTPYHGTNYFAGGPANALSSASQDIDLTAYASSIDAGSATYDLSGLLGGYLTQGDNASLSVTFRDASNATLGSTTIGPVTAADRGNANALLLRQTSGTVPVNTRSVSATITMTRLAGSYNDGYADDLAFSVCTPAVADPPPTVPSHTLQTSYPEIGPSSFTVIFSEPVANTGGGIGTDDAANPNNYVLMEQGAESGFQTTGCNNLSAQDTRVTPSGVTFIPPSTSIINLGSPLPTGTYRLFVCGTTSILDLGGNALAGDGVTSGTDFIFNFVVGNAGTAKARNKASALPATGFPMGRITRLPAQPAEKAYTGTDLELEIPTLKVSMPIVGVPQTEKSWDISWLGSNAGWLTGSTFPTWVGNSVLTGHVWDANNLPGPFANLKTLKYGDQILVRAFGQTYTYEVRESRLLWGDGSVNAVFKHHDEAWLTLLTCETYNPLTGGYLSRRMVGAVLISVK